MRCFSGTVSSTSATVNVLAAGWLLFTCLMCVFFIVVAPVLVVVLVLAVTLEPSLSLPVGFVAVILVFLVTSLVSVPVVVIVLA